jgi:hypothetical protein
VLLLDDSTPVINKGTVLYLEEFHFMHENPWIHKHSCSDKKAGIRVHEPGWHHAHSILLVSHSDGMTSIWTYTAPGDDGRMVLISDMGHNLSFSLVPEKSADDNRTTHCPTI